MMQFLKTSAAVALLGLGLITPSLAQDASEMAVRMQQLEDQVRLLMGQVEQLDYEVKQLRAVTGQTTGEAQKPARKKAAAAAIPDADDGIEVMQLAPAAPAAPATSESDLSLQKAPAPTVLGALDNASAQPDDGGFQGKVLVPPSQQEPGDDAFVIQNAPQPSSADTDDAIETVALNPESPEALYERSNESLLRRQFADAEAGFSTFLSKYPDHSLAGSAQFWLGETYFAQGEFKRAAQNFLQGYKTYPKSRRAADSLLKLGVSLSRLGQAEQACAAYAAVSAEYPKAVEARKRAQAEAKRASCAS